MIEKLKTINPYDETEIDMDVNSVAGLVYENTPLVQKINELVDAVNELQKHEEQHLDLLTELNEMRLHQNKGTKKEPLDHYIKQRKWVGKLCKFEGENYGILKEIGCSNTTQVWRDGAFRSSDGYWYDICEPVKPDDDIIYKGE